MIDLKSIESDEHIRNTVGALEEALVDARAGKLSSVIVFGDVRGEGHTKVYKSGYFDRFATVGRLKLWLRGPPLMTLGTEIARVSDELNLALTEAEEALVEMRLGVRASVVAADDSGTLEYLTFGKSGSSWRLLWETANAINPSDRESVPLVNTSRLNRCTAAGLLPALRKALEEEAARQIGEAKVRIGQVREFLGRTP